MTATRAYYHDGEMPVNISGGLKSFGHPIGASGCREVYEIYKQIQHKAEEPSRQVKDVKLGLAHNQGGHPGKFVCGVTVLGHTLVFGLTGLGSGEGQYKWPMSSLFVACATTSN